MGLLAFQIHAASKVGIMLREPLFSDAIAAFSVGDLRNGRELITKILAEFHDKAHAGQAVGIYLDYELFDDALNVFTDYKLRVGKELKCDFDVVEIKALKKISYQIQRDGDDLIFEYMSIRERGFLSGMRRLFPINRIRINEKSITFESLLSKEKFMWEEMTKLRLIKQKTQIGVGSSYWQSVLVFNFGKNKKIIDITKHLPDYRGNIVLVAFLKRRFDIVELNNTRVRIFNWPGFLLVIGCVILAIYIYLKDYGYLS